MKYAGNARMPGPALGSCQLGLLIGTGSEVSLGLNAQEALKKQGVEARVTSMPSWKLFEDRMRRIAKKFGFTVEDVVAAAIEQSNSVKG